MQEKLTDASLMPFGKHKNKKLGDVPADYLLWAGDNFEPTNDWRKAFLVYVAENRAALEKEVEETKNDE